MPTFKKLFFGMLFYNLHKNGFTFYEAGKAAGKTGAYLTGKGVDDFVAAGIFVIQNGAQA
ncbi:MAG: hypothetical protein H7A08_09620 [Oceanospirillaceae bacterium]|nr:hypothetical protein [Oceanospirillaceae bacterium]MCP5350863.1 hypothetical protein [Oceanospirillaceae bacterium]